MVKNKLTSQQKWNKKHSDIMQKDSLRYYYRHRKQVLKQQKRYRMRKKNYERKKVTE